MLAASGDDAAGRGEAAALAVLPVPPPTSCASGGCGVRDRRHSAAGKSEGELASHELARCLGRCCWLVLPPPMPPPLARMVAAAAVVVVVVAAPASLSSSARGRRGRSALRSHGV
jgi:hypothetical protein